MHKQNNDIEEHDLIIYLTDKGDEALVKKVDQWLKQSPENLQHFEEVKKLWETAEGIEVFDQIDLDTNWASFKQKVNTAEKAGGKPINWFQSMWKIAAAIAIIAICTYIILDMGADDQPSLVAITSEYGNPGPYSLPDGSSIWLNQDSKVTYTEDYGVNHRKIDLEGEAFFEVKEDTNTPFVVALNGTETKVLGTSFNLKGVEDGITLVLVTGQVKLTKGASEHILNPGEVAYTDAKGQLVKAVNSNPNFNAWKTGKLVFEEQPIQDVVRDINNFYHVDIKIDNESLKTCPLTTEFDQATLEEVLETLKTIFDLTLTQEGESKYTLKGKGC